MTNVFSRFAVFCLLFLSLSAFAQGEEEYNGPVGTKSTELSAKSKDNHGDKSFDKPKDTTHSAEVSEGAKQNQDASMNVSDSHQSDSEHKENSAKEGKTEGHAEESKAKSDSDAQHGETVSKETSDSNFKAGEKGNGILWFLVVSIVLVVLVFAFT
jgi:cobalamin biosynthesis Mg chelatase CobN